MSSGWPMVMHGTHSPPLPSRTSYKPLPISLAINPEHASYKLLVASGVWTISVLGSEQIALAHALARRPLRAPTRCMAYGESGQGPVRRT